MKSRKRKVLSIDDNKTNLVLSKVHLERMGLDVIVADNSETGVELAIEEQPDLILLDIMMPDVDGYETCKRLKSDKRTSNIPIIFLSAKGQATDKVAGLEIGAIDYITKPFDPAEFRARVNIILQMVSLQERLLSQANTDELTGIANRRCFNEILEREVLQAKTSSRSLSLVMLDIDHFKKINDTYGHLGGDIILRQMADLLRNSIRHTDILARYGGEEFVIVMPDTTSRHADAAAEKMRQLVESCHWKVSVEHVHVTISMGLVSMDVRNPSIAEEMIRRADGALYSAKQRGRNCVVRWEQIDCNDDEPQEQHEEFREIRGKITDIVGRSRVDLINQIFQMIQSVEEAGKCYPGHSENVLCYTAALAEALDLPDETIDHLLVATKFHDLGSLSIPRDILTKPGPLTKFERHIINQHTLISVQILEPIGMFRNELPIIRHHHERFDGLGYPDGLRGHAIPFGARILAVADTFDGITAERVYRNASTLEQAVKEIRDHAGTQFDPQVVNAFVRVAEQHKDVWPLEPKLISV